MAIQVNSKGVSHAENLIKQGKVDKESSWSFSTEDENSILGDNNWDNYAKWFLAIDTEKNEDTKARYKFPYGKNGKVYRKGVIAAKQRAAQNGYENIVKAADKLLNLIDKDNEKFIETPPVETQFIRTFSIDSRGIVDDENKIVELSFSSEAPVERWFGREILLHENKSVNLSPVKEVGTVLINHDPNQRVAKPIKVWIENKRGKALIQFANTDLAKQAYQEVKEGLLRGVSVGYQVQEWMRLREDETYKDFQGPAWIATKWSVHEISLTPVPADAGVGVGRAKESIFIKEGDSMEKEKKKQEETRAPETEVRAQEGQEKPEINVEEVIAKERQRIKEISALCERFGFSELAGDLIEKGTPVEEARKIILDKLAEENTPTGQAVRVDIVADERDKFRDAVVDAMIVRAGIVDPYSSDKEVKLADGYREFANMTLLDIAKECLKRANVPFKGLSRMDIAGRAFTHTTSDFPIILQNIANKSLMEGFNAEPETWQKWCATGSVSDFKTHTMVRVGEFDDLEEVKEGAEYKKAEKIYEQQEQYSIATYGKLFSITRQTIINDDLNALSIVPRNMGEAARRKIADLAYSVLIENPKMGDGNNLFSSAHSNLASTGSAPTFDALKAAIKAMMKQKDIGGKRRLHIRPQFIILPVEYLMDVEELLNMQYIDHPQGKPNVLRKYNLSIVADGRLDDAGSAWYLAGPKGKTVVLYFLDGQQAPALETQRGWEVDGVQYKVRIDCGAKAVSWKALYKNPGA